MKQLEYPFTRAKVKDLRIGQVVRVSGKLFTGRDRLHKFLAEGGRCPVELKDGGLYHCGPVVLREDGRWVVKAAGPTTSMREEPYMATIIERFGPRVIVGKGGMGEATREACRAFGCVYLQAVGGAAAVLAASVASVADVHFLKEFGPAEALWEFDLRDLEVMVTIDTRGRSLHRRIALSSRRAVEAILNG